MITEHEALQNAADGLNLIIYQKLFPDDRRRTTKKYFANNGIETVSPVLDYKQLNYFLLGWRASLKQLNKKHETVNY